MTPESKAINNLLGYMFADITPTESIVKCPKCNGRLLISVMLVVHVPVTLRKWRDGQQELRYRGDFIETRTQLLKDSASEYSGAAVDPRDELYCENYNVDGGCDYWEQA